MLFTLFKNFDEKLLYCIVNKNKLNNCLSANIFIRKITICLVLNSGSANLPTIETSSDSDPRFELRRNFAANFLSTTIQQNQENFLKSTFQTNSSYLNESHDLVSISPTFYERHFCTKVLCTAFL